MKNKGVKAAALITAVILSFILCAAFSVNAEEKNNYQSASAAELSVNGVNAASPEISSIVNRKTGADISWSKVQGASKYRVFVKENDDWARLGDTTETHFIHTSAASNRVYYYTVRAMDSDGNYISSYSQQGTSNRYYAAPAPSYAANAYGGVKFAWEKVSGAPGYRVYRKTANGPWEVIKNFTTELSIKDKTVSNKTSYSYTVRVVSADRTKNLSSFYSNGKTITYYAAPEITGTQNGRNSVRINFTKVPNASKYRVYVLKDGEWKKAATVTDSSAVYADVAGGVYYTYTVRAFDSKGNFLTGYNPDGYKAAYYKPPVIESVTSSGGAYTVKWKAVSDVPMYRVYRKTMGGSWSIAGYSSSLSFTDKKAASDKLTTYTLRCVSKSKKAVSSFVETGVYYYNGKPAEGTFTVDGKKYAFKEGQLCSGFVKLDGKTYYYGADGKVVKDSVVGSKATGFYYAGEDGEITFKFNGIAKNDYGYWYCKNSKVDLTYRNAVTYDGNDWLVINGKAKQVKTEKDKTLFRAFKEIEKCTDDSMTKSEKLRAAFKYVQGAYTEKNPRVPHYHGDGWVELYANDMFVDRTGNCCSYGAAFAYMAKAIGYEEVYACNSGGHGWAEIDGKVYDPEWGRHKTDKDYYALDYDTCKDPAYKAAISAGYDWMHVKV